MTRGNAYEAALSGDGFTIMPSAARGIIPNNAAPIEKTGGFQGNKQA
jgi:hypothetical protein